MRAERNQTFDSYQELKKKYANLTSQKNELTEKVACLENENSSKQERIDELQADLLLEKSATVSKKAKFTIQSSSDDDRFGEDSDFHSSEEKSETTKLLKRISDRLMRKVKKKRYTIDEEGNMVTETYFSEEEVTEEEMELEKKKRKSMRYKNVSFYKQ